MSERSLVTALIGFDTALGPAVTKEIEKCGNPLKRRISDRLDAAGVVHFASLSVVEVSGALSYIVIELSADADDAAALRIFANTMQPELMKILDKAGLPRPLRPDRWLAAKKLRIGQGFSGTCGLLFDGSPEMTVARIKRENELVKWILTRLDLLRVPGAAEAKLAALRKALWATGNSKPAFVPQPAPFLDPAPANGTILDKLRLALKILYRFLIWPTPVVPVLFIILFLWPRSCGWRGHLFWPLLETIALLAAAAIAFAVAVRRRERREPAPVARPDKAALEKILERENWNSQNVLLTSSVLKPGLLRRICLHLSLFGVKTLLPILWAPGRLGTINDIHFACWVLLPRSDILIFRSHYDGSWLSYLEDFVLRAPQGVTGIWSNTQGFPRTRLLVGNGAQDGPRFLQWARTQTRPAIFLYSAYPSLSMEQIRLNARIARAIATGTMDDGVRGWLASLGDADGGDF